jgi:hypothetical protein
MLQETQTETGDTKDFQEAIFIRSPAVAQQIHIQRLSPKNKGVSLYIPLQAGYRSKKARFNPYMVAWNSIGQFTTSVT